MIGAVLGQQLVAEPQYLCFLGVTSQAWPVTWTPAGASARARAAVSAMVSGCKSQAATEQP